jgi:hypothetical protein
VISRFRKDEEEVVRTGAFLMVRKDKEEVVR